MADPAVPDGEDPAAPDGADPAGAAVWGGRRSDGVDVVVVGFDASRAAHHALAYAVGICRRTRSTLLVVSVLTGPGVAGLSSAATAAVVADRPELVQATRSEVAPYLDQLGLAWSLHVRVGTPAQQIEALAEQEHADVIVVGRSGGLPRRAVLGSVPRWLVHHAERPVVVVP